MEQKEFKFEVTAVDIEEGVFTGYASTFSKKPDTYGDIVEPGAFSKTLKEGKGRIKVLWNHNANEPIGKPLEIIEDEKGLRVECKLSLGVQRAREVLSLMKDGVISHLSFGYDSVKDSWHNGVRHLLEVRLWDVSPVTFSANSEAMVISVKRATTFSDLPLADRAQAWDATAAGLKVRDWAGGKDNMNWSKYRQAFFWYDENDSELFGAYKLGFADILNGRLTAIPRGVFIVAAVMQGARGGVNIPNAERGAVEAHVEKYYAKMRKEFDDEGIIAPWAKAEMKPYPNEHACRLRDPDDFKDDSFRRVPRVSDDKTYFVIMGKLKEDGDALVEQAYRYPKDVWTEDEAGSHCERHEGSFEPAVKKAATAFSDLPIADRGMEWAATAARDRVGVWAKEDGVMNWANYGKAFFWYDEEKPTSLGSYKLGFADVVDGKLLAVPSGIFAAATATGKSEEVEIPEGDVAGVVAHINSYYDKMNMESPLKGKKSGRVLSAASLEKIKAAFVALQALLEAAEREEEPTKFTPLTGAVLEAAELERLVGTLKAENEGFDVKEAEKRIEVLLTKLRT